MLAAGPIWGKTLRQLRRGQAGRAAWTAHEGAARDKTPINSIAMASPQDDFGAVGPALLSSHTETTCVVC